MDSKIEETDAQPRVKWTGKGAASASEALTIQGGKIRGGCLLKPLLTADRQESAGIKGKLLGMGYELATVSRAAPELAISGDVQQDKRGRLTFWRMPAQ